MSQDQFPTQPDNWWISIPLIVVGVLMVFGPALLKRLRGVRSPKSPADRP